MSPMMPCDVFVEDIPAEGLSIQAAAHKDAWVTAVMREVFGAAFADEDTAELNVLCTKVHRDVDVVGSLRYSVHPECDRCLDPFSRTGEVPLHLHLAPLYENKRQKRIESEDEEALVRDDENFSYYEGDRFDLAELLREQLLLSLPMRNVPEEDADGRCTVCHRSMVELYPSKN